MLAANNANGIMIASKRQEDEAMKDLFPRPLSSLPSGWEVCTQAEARAEAEIVRAWVASTHTFRPADRSTAGRNVTAARPQYIRRVK